MEWECGVDQNQELEWSFVRQSTVDTQPQDINIVQGISI